MLSNHLEPVLYSRSAYISSGSVNKIPAAPEFSRTVYSYGRYEFSNTTSFIALLRRYVL